MNLVGYAPDAPHKAADLYSWLGDGGARDYSSFEGNTVYVYDVANGQAYPVGAVAFWKPGGADVGWYNLTRSAGVERGLLRLQRRRAPTASWSTASAAARTSRSRPDVYADPFKVSLRGFFYMRIGQDNAAAISPPPRTPLYIPGRSPANTTVYLTDDAALRTRDGAASPAATPGTSPTTGRRTASPATRPTPTPGAATPTPPTGIATSGTCRSSTTCCCPTS